MSRTRPNHDCSGESSHGAFWKSSSAVVALVFGLSACGQATSGPTENREAQLKPGITLHWKGADAIKADTNSTELIDIAALPESRAMFNQTLEKLVRAPWILRGLELDTNTSIALQPLVKDILANPTSYGLALDPKERSCWALACKLNEQQASSWESTLADALRSLTGNDPSPLPDGHPGWLIPAPGRVASKEAGPGGEGKPTTIYLTRSGQWTVVGGASDLPTFLTFSRSIVVEYVRREPTGAPWLRASVDVAELNRLYPVPANILRPYPEAELAVCGRNGQVHCTLDLHFPEALDLELSSWQIPSELIQQPLVSFVAVRGLNTWLGRSTRWRDLEFEEDPSQLFAWAIGGRPMLSYFAAKTSNPEAFVKQATSLILPNGTAWQSEDGVTGFKPAAKYDGVEWNGMPYVFPVLRSVTTTNQGSYVLGGAFIHTPPAEPLDAGFYEEALAPEDLVFYGWEQSGPRLAHWLFIGQFIRYTAGYAQLPTRGAAVGWIAAAKNRLGNTFTRVHQTSPQDLKMTRSSSLGLTAFELHLLLDWLESPTFPRGLHMFEGEPSR